MDIARIGKGVLAGVRMRKCSAAHGADPYARNQGKRMTMARPRGSTSSVLRIDGAIVLHHGTKVNMGKGSIKPARSDGYETGVIVPWKFSDMARVMC